MRKLQIMQPGGTDPLASFDLTAEGGVESDSVPFEVWNLGDQEETEIALFTAQKDPSGAWVQNSQLLSNRWLYMRLVGVVGGPGISLQLTGWMPVGYGRPFPMNRIPPGCGRQVELKIAAPGSLTPEVLNLKLWPISQGPATPAGLGLFAAGARGIPTGLGDGLATYVVSGGGLTASGSPDANVHLEDTQAVVSGQRVVALAQAVALDDNAASGALAAGESYLATLSLGLSGVVVTKSNAGAFPMDPDLRPAVPADSVLLGWVEKQHAGVIASANIEQGPARGGFALSSAGLTATLSGGEALVDDMLIRLEAETDITLPPSSTCYLHLLPTGDTALLTDASRPDPRALLLYVVTTGTVAITAVRDLRPWLRRARRFVFRLPGVLAVNATMTLPYDGDAEATPSLPFAVAVSLDDAGTSTTSGATIVDLEVFNPGGAWVSLWPSSGTTDRRPTIAYNAAELRAAAVPEASGPIKPGARMRLTVRQIPTVGGGGSAPSGLSLIFTVEE